MKKLIIVAMLVLSTVSVAELPSWGMTENQYNLPNFNSKMKEIGAQAASNNWLLKITAPKDWHKKIRVGLTDSGARDVQVNFKDSLYQSIAISAAKGLKIANVSSSSSSNTTVQKQVVIDKPEIDSAVAAPEFEKLNIKSNNNELLESITNMEIAVPKSTDMNSQKAERPAVPASPKPAAKAPVQAPAPAQAQTSQNVAVISTDANIDEMKESLRKRHARSKRVERSISYSNINAKDELFIQANVVLVKRFINQGAVLYYWMEEAYNPVVHKLVEKGSGKYQKDPDAVAGDRVASSTEKNASEEVKIEPTKLDFVADVSNTEDQDSLRKSHARNKLVDTNIRANQLKADDVLYVLNNTVLVERPITRVQSAHFWLVGDTTITREVEVKDDNQFIIR